MFVKQIKKIKKVKTIKCWSLNSCPLPHAVAQTPPALHNLIPDVAVCLPRMEVGHKVLLLSVRSV